MVTREENEVLVRSGAETPMGQVFRRFWIPVLLSSELPVPNCAPVAVTVLGEKLVVFRNAEGKVGALDAYCPHRGGPLFYGYCESGGIVCPYHGARFEVDGRCTDLPFVQNGDKLKEKLSTKSYPVEERAGMLWAYMGPPELKPPLPGFQFMDLPGSHIYVTKYLIDCNWLQSMESDLEPVHAFFLHADRTGAGKADSITGYNVSAKPKMPDILEVEDTPSGFRMAYRWDTKAMSPGFDKIAVSHFYLPSFGNQAIAPDGVYGGNLRVPLDDEHFWLFRLRWSRSPLSAQQLYEDRSGGFTFAEHELGGWRPKANAGNDYLRDHIVARNYNRTGISSFAVQDFMAQEHQWGPVADRTKEHLFASDRMIVQLRRRLLALAEKVAAGEKLAEPFASADYGSHHVRIPFPAEETVGPAQLADLYQRSFT